MHSPLLQQYSQPEWISIQWLHPTNENNRQTVGWRVTWSNWCQKLSEECSSWPNDHTEVCLVIAKYWPTCFAIFSQRYWYAENPGHSCMKNWHLRSQKELVFLNFSHFHWLKNWEESCNTSPTCIPWLFQIERKRHALDVLSWAKSGWGLGLRIQEIHWQFFDNKRLHLEF